MSTESAPPPRPASGLLGCLGAAVLLSLCLLVFGIGLMVAGIGWISQSLSHAQTKWNHSTPLIDEVVLRGDTERKDLDTAPRLAVIQVQGVLVEGSVEDAIDHVDQALADDRVKGLIIRIDSPGGTLTAAHALYAKIRSFGEKGAGQGKKGKPVVASIGPMAASGGYYVAMACKPVLAEAQSQTGSIGVYVSFPNFEGIAKEWGFGSTLIKQGDIKDSGNPLRTPTPKEKQVWQDLVDEGYNDFVEVIEANRPALKGKLLEPMKMKAVRAGPVGADGLAEYSRYRADGGIWTARQAKAAGLIDDIGSLEEAIDRALTLADLNQDALVIEYERPQGLIDSLLGRNHRRHDPIFDIPGFEKALASLGSGPRTWCLAPGFEMEGAAALFKAELRRSHAGLRGKSPRRP